MSTDLQQRVLAFINGGAGSFEELALEVFAFQFENCATYRAYCEHQQRTPATVNDWREIPATPTSAFKDFELTCFPVEQAVVEFHTSGTTRARAGKHYFKTLELYEAAARPNFIAHVGDLPVLSLIPEDRHSSLAHMVSLFQPQPFRTDVDEPVIVVGTAFAFMNLFDGGFRAEFPAGSRAMETGGYKGRSREVPKRELHRLIHERLGIETVVNEYGMTELSTQFYDERPGSDIKDVPHWARVQVIDPRTGKEAAQGQPGLIRVYDLANVWSMMCVQPEDLGVMRDTGFEVLGRAAGAEVRGCSLNAESLSTS